MYVCAGVLWACGRWGLHKTQSLRGWRLRGMAVGLLLVRDGGRVERGRIRLTPACGAIGWGTMSGSV